MSFGKRSLLSIVAVLAAGVVAAVAVGQDVSTMPLGVWVKATSNQAGTPRHPRGIRIDVHKIGDAASPMPRSFDVWLPRGWVYNGGKHPVCALEKLSHGGPKACPPRSIMGRGEFGPVEDRPSTSPPGVIILNGGHTKMYFWLVLLTPARVQAAVPGAIAKLRSPRWSYRVHAEIPPSLQVVAGIRTLLLQNFRGSFGRGDWIATTGCPRDHRWHYRFRVTSTSGQVVDDDGAMACRR